MVLCLVIGAGNMGLRHSQGLLRFLPESSVVLTDLDKKQLRTVCGILAEEFGNRVSCVQQFSSLPSTADIAILAVPADRRREVALNLSHVNFAGHLLLEKPLACTGDDINQLVRLSKHFESTHVNFARRMFPNFAELKAYLGGHRVRSVAVSGSRWGLASNGPHFVDLVMYLKSNEAQTAEVDPSFWYEQKRPGYVDFVGKAHLTFNDGAELTMTAAQDGAAPLRIELVTDSETISVIQDEQYMTASFGSNYRSKAPLQSQLTGKVVQQLMSTGSCELPSLLEVAGSQKVLADALSSAWHRTATTDLRFT